MFGTKASKDSPISWMFTCDTCAARWMISIQKNCSEPCEVLATSSARRPRREYPLYSLSPDHVVRRSANRGLPLVQCRSLPGPAGLSGGQSGADAVSALGTNRRFAYG